MIVTITLNPAFDKALTIDTLQPGALHRARLGPVVPSGKGINVARMVKAWGEPVMAVAWAGEGRSVFASYLESHGIASYFIPVAGAIRTNLKLFEEMCGRMTEINEPGPLVSVADFAALEQTLLSLCSTARLFVFSGSLPLGAPVDTYARLAQLVASKGVPVVVDTSGAALQLTMNQSGRLLFAVKPNQVEAEDLFGSSLSATGAERELALLHHMYKLGIPHIVLTLGAKGALFCAEGTILRTIPPSIQAGNTAGAGDALLATYLVGVLQGWPLAERAVRATAAGAAAARGLGTDLATVDEILELASSVQVRVEENA